MARWSTVVDGRGPKGTFLKSDLDVYPEVGNDSGSSTAGIRKGAVNTSTKTTSPRQRATKETALLTGFLFFGLVVVPFLIYQVGQIVFGAYGGVGYGEFFASLGTRIRSADPVAWFLVLSPYLGWQCLRLILLGWRLTGPKQDAT